MVDLDAYENIDGVNPLITNVFVVKVDGLKRPRLRLADVLFYAR
jgi:hypothetical protein